MSNSGSGTLINCGSSSDFLTSYGSGSASQKVTVPVPWNCLKAFQSFKKTYLCRSKRKIETELNDMKEQVTEKKQQVSFVLFIHYVVFSICHCIFHYPPPHPWADDIQSKVLLKREPLVIPGLPFPFRKTYLAWHLAFISSGGTLKRPPPPWCTVHLF